jgi:hypothetical protein
MNDISNIPIKLNILDRNANITKTYIFLGNDVPNDIRSILGQYKKNISKKSETILKKRYGRYWKNLLNLTNDKLGGNENSEIILNDEIEQIDQDNPEEISLSEIQSLAKILDDKNYQSDQINKINQETEKPTKEPKEKIPQELIKSQKKLESHTIYVYDFYMNPYDNISEFKKKISTVTNIPIYKQNIWYKIQKNIVNMQYNVFLKKKITNISIIKNIIDNTDVEFINDIPILIHFYNLRNLINIKMTDPFTILDDICKLGVSEFNLFNMDDFVSDIKTDKNDLEIVYWGLISIFWPMMTYPVWLDYANNSVVDFEKIYPELALNLVSNIKIFKEETSIIKSTINYNFGNSDKINKLKKLFKEKLFIGIRESTIVVQSFQNQNILNIRNLFDLIVLSDTYLACKCSLTYNDKKIILNKTFMDNGQINTSIPMNTFLLKVMIDAENMDFLNIYLHLNGNMTIKAKWSEDKLYNFDDIFKIVAKQTDIIINMINKMGSSVINSNYTLEKMTENNASFAEIDMSMIYRNPLKHSEFKLLESILNKYLDGGIMRLSNINHELNTLEYYFAKGMHWFDVERINNIFLLNNYYDYLTNPAVNTKWEQLFQNTRKTIFQYRQGDIEISINGIKEDEFDIFYLFIINIFSELENKRKDLKISSTEVIKQSIKTLKYQDPILYDFKKIYNSPIIYSRLCQKQNQPRIISESEYLSLSKPKQATVTKYHNFTTNTPAYYQCPNPKYPHLQFTVNKHPKDYCIPCCKIKPLPTGISHNTENSVKQLIYDTCLKEHKYTKIKGNITLDSRYIMSYGKYITPGQLSTLPENSVEPLLYDTFSDNLDKNINTEKVNTNDSSKEVNCGALSKIYLYGIEQNIKHIQNVGYITSLAFTLDVPVHEFIKDSITFINKRENIFKMILDGKIIKYFKTTKLLTESLKSTFLDACEACPSLTFNNIPWNDIFIDIAYYYYNIISVVFTDVKLDQSIKLHLTNKLNSAQLLGHYKTILLVKNKDYYNPIYRINTVVYFKTKLIEKKIFDKDDKIIDIVNKLILYDSKELNVIDLDTYANFVKTNTKYKITKYFVNKHNLCYYIEITVAQKKIYIPINFSKYISNGDTDYELFTIKKYPTGFQELNKFLKDFNIWIGSTTPIIVDKWIYLDNPWSKSKSNKTPILGFIHNKLNYYHQPLPYEFVKKLNSAPLERILYHPDMINKNLNMEQAVVDPRIKNITKNLYDYKLYELLLLEYIVFLNKEKNIELRNEIKKCILKKKLKPDEIINEVVALINSYYEKYDITDDGDIPKITQQINNYKISHDKKTLFEKIDSSVYTFDKIKINSFKIMEKGKLISELHKFSKRIVIIESEKNITKALGNLKEFPNMFISCQDISSDVIYCKKNKLVITEKNLTILLEIMASDILNPIKSKWIFNNVFTDNIINFLKFKQNPNETIEIHSL